MHTKLSGKERIKLALEHKTTDRIPIGMLCGGINQPALDAFDSYLRKNYDIDTETYINRFLDIVEVWADHLSPKYGSDTDIWGVKRKKVSYGQGSYNEIAYSPLSSAATIHDIKNYPWPKTSMFDYSVIPSMMKERRKNEGQALIASTAFIFEAAWAMRGLEQIFMDMLTAPELVHAMFDKITTFNIEHFTKILKAANGEIEYIFTADDVGGQSGLLMSKELYEEFLKPYHTRMNEAFHNEGVRIFYHSCGSVTDLVENIMATGIDVLESLQFNAEGMEPDILKSRFGDRLCFEGGVCVQNLLPFGKPSEVNDYIKNLIDVLGKNGGYILGPSHFIQAGTPPENVYAMFDTALNYYPYK
jgi:uroporphyrinogen decarboxylase